MSATYVPSFLFISADAFLLSFFFCAEKFFVLPAIQAVAGRLSGGGFLSCSPPPPKRFLLHLPPKQSPPFFFRYPSGLLFFPFFHLFAICFFFCRSPMPPFPTSPGNFPYIPPLWIHTVPFVNGFQNRFLIGRFSSHHVYVLGGRVPIPVAPADRLPFLVPTYYERVGLLSILFRAQ